MAFAGLRGTGDWGTDERPKNFREMILWADPNGQTPLTALMARMKTQKTDDPEYAWWEEKLQPVRIVTGADLSAASTTVTVASGALNLVAGDLLLFEKNATDSAVASNEVVTVASVTNDTTFVIVRGSAGSTAVGQVSGTAFTRIGSAFAEGTRSPGTSSRNPTKLYNFAQIFKTKYEITRTAKGTRTRTGDPLANDRKRKSFDHSVGLELAFFFGMKYEIVASAENNKPKRYMGGLRSFLSSNVKRWTSTPTEDQFLDFLAPMFDFNTLGSNDERIMLCGRGVSTSLAKMVRNNTNTQITYNGGVDGTYKMKLNRMELPFGVIGWKTHPLFNIHPKFQNSFFVLNPPAIKYRPFMDTTFKDNIQDNDADTQAGMWITEAGMEVNHEWTMGYGENFLI